MTTFHVPIGTKCFFMRTKF